MSIILFILYPIAIQAEKGGWWLIVSPITAFAFVLDVLANYTELALITCDCPQKGEWTFSTRLKRLQYYPGWRGSFARVCRDYCNFFDAGHI